MYYNEPSYIVEDIERLEREFDKWEQRRQKREAQLARERRARRNKILATICYWISLILLIGYVVYTTNKNDAWSFVLRFLLVTAGIFIFEIVNLHIAAAIMYGWLPLIIPLCIVYIASMMYDFHIYGTSGICFDYDLLWLMALMFIRRLLMGLFPFIYMGIWDRIEGNV